MIYTLQSDELLVTMTLTGDNDAYCELVRRYERKVTRTAFNIVNNRCLAEDAAQDAFVSAWMKLNTLNDFSKFGSWVCRIARNRAINLAKCQRDYMSFELFEKLEYESKQLPEWMICREDTSESLNDSVEGLPEKVREVIRLHYYEGYSLAEIAAKLTIPIGTVKSRLADGRRRLREDFGVMEEKTNEKLVKRIMERVEALKLWQLKDVKTGFIDEYKPLLRDIESMPESEEKYHALSDVLQLGWWWLPGEQNDKTLERLRDAAYRSGNEDVIITILIADNGKLSGKDKLDFMLNTQIPQLEEKGYKKALGYLWFWIGFEYRELGSDKYEEAFNRVIEILEPSDKYYAAALSAIEMEKRCKGLDADSYVICVGSTEYRRIGSTLRHWSSPGYSTGNLRINEWDDVPYLASMCEGCFFDEALPLGGVMTATNGTTLTFEADNDTVDTPAGRFDGCQRWVTCLDRSSTHYKNSMINRVATWYKRGVGIVKLLVDDINDSYGFALKAYKVNGDGLLPMQTGNRWDYDCGYGDSFEYQNMYETVYADDENCIVAEYNFIHRLSYNSMSWSDMKYALRFGYSKSLDNGEEVLVDVSHYLERMEVLAKTPAERAYTAAAGSVMRRVLACDPVFNPDHTAIGHWNFLTSLTVVPLNGKLMLDLDWRDCFEWKDMDGKYDYSLLYNDIYEIFTDNVDCIWSDEWYDGFKGEYKYRSYKGTETVTHYTISNAGAIETAAGCFEDCLKVAIHCEGDKYSGGLWYRGVDKEYYFARGIGIVKTVNHLSEDKTPVFELTAYTGVGEGYFPYGDGFMRRYDAVGLTDGYEASVVYTYAADENCVRIFADRTGIQHIDK